MFFKGCIDFCTYLKLQKQLTLIIFPLSTTLNAVANNKHIYTQQEIEGAGRSIKIQQQMVWPSLFTLKYYIANNPIQNYAVTIDDIKRAYRIYGTLIPILKVNMSKQSNP